MTAAKQTKAKVAGTHAAAPLDPPAIRHTQASANDDQAAAPDVQPDPTPAEQPQAAPALSVPASKQPGELAAPPQPATATATAALTAAAPLAPPAGPTTAGVSVNEPAIPRQQVNVGETFVGYVGQDGSPLDPDDLFDMSGTGNLATTKQRAIAVVRRASGRLMHSLAWTPSTEVTKVEALRFTAHAKAGRQAADEFGLYSAE